MSHGSEKYLLYGKLALRVTGHNGKHPLRVDFREGEGGHYLDTFTVLTDTSKIKPKDKGPILDVNGPQQTVDTGFQKDIHLTVAQVQDAAADTEEFVTHEEEITVNHVHSEELPDEVLIELREKYEERWPENMTMEDCTKKMQWIMEDPNSHDWEKLEAIHAFESRIQTLNRIKNYYANHKANLIQLNNMRTRSQKDKEEE
jgi:hypothetical protein